MLASHEVLFRRESPSRRDALATLLHPTTSVLRLPSELLHQVQKAPYRVPFLIDNPGPVPCEEPTRSFDHTLHSLRSWRHGGCQRLLPVLDLSVVLPWGISKVQSSTQVETPA